jgi:hypothetical protein
LPSTILAPLVALVLWSFVMLTWLYATRIPAVMRQAIVFDPQRLPEEFHAQLPATVRWKADNFNNLMEQPMLFYAVTLALAVLGHGETVDVALAWLYVSLRIAHSLVQALVNVIMVRFAIFIAASVVLLALSIRAAMLVF